MGGSGGVSGFGAGGGKVDGGDDDDDEKESFLLVLGDHLYRRGLGSTRSCSSQLLHAFLEHGEAGKPAIGLKVCRVLARCRWGRGGASCFCTGEVSRCGRLLLVLHFLWPKYLSRGV